eukprot:TRINITY_DN5012_c0_g2_i1.p1 TRINITY_DN5012_c0_g2~~TRINITY_DN5012_c0_g2_i1.p1  ORF type:complete len:351 (-),score=39.59 TRINITY_DN5012_c0_g2_i1:90-1121(-)
MSHSSGIPVAKELQEQFGEALSSNKIRFIKAQIREDAIHPVSCFDIAGTMTEDLDKIPSFLDAAEPSYILFRADDKDESGSNLWLLMCYVPDRSKVRDKMTYASSRSNLRLQLGSNRFSDEIFGTVAQDFNSKGFQAYESMKKADVPLTWTEQQAVQDKEGGVFIGGSGTAYIHGISFPVAKDAEQAIRNLLSGTTNYVQLAIDAENIVLACSRHIEPSELELQVPNDEPRFHFFSYDHVYENESIRSLIFVYSCPDGSGPTKSAPVRLRMLYSSSKANVEGIVTSMGGNVALKLEINQGNELSEGSLLSKLHPDKAEEKKAFSKPKGPSKGGKRLIRGDKKE